MILSEHQNSQHRSNQLNAEGEIHDSLKQEFPSSHAELAHASPSNYGQELEYKIASTLIRSFTTPIVVDVGVERGSFIELARDAGASQIIGFEPLPRHFKALASQFIGNGQIVVHPIAISDRNGYAQFHIATDLDGKELDFHHTLGDLGDSATVIRSKRTLRVETATLSDLISKGLVPSNIDFLKIDTDGHDLSVLQGLGIFCPRIIMAEYWDTLPETSGENPYRLSDLAKWATEHGYSRMLIVRRHGHMETIQWDAPWTIEGDWGNVFFFRQDFENTRSLEHLTNMAKESHQSLVSYVSHLAKECDAKEAVIKELSAAIQQKANISAPETTPLWPPVVSLNANLYAQDDTIQIPTVALRDIYATLAQKDKALAEMQIVLAKKDSVFVDTLAALSQVDRGFAEMLSAVSTKILSEANAGNSSTDSLTALTDKGTGTAELSELEKKEAVIQELSKALHAYKMSHFLLNPVQYITRMIARFKARLRPRLGVLIQHHPVPLRKLEPYVATIPATKLPLISIVTPSYNQGQFIERTMRSILDQGYPKIEYIVQDGASTDDTIAVLERYQSQLTRWESSVDGGQSEAINRGFVESTGEIMAWLNSDDILMPGALTCIAEYFALHPDVDVVYGNRLLIDEDDNEIGRWTLPGHDRAVLSWADYIPQETMYWRRTIWEKTDARIDESFRFAMDWDLLLRFRNAGAKFAHIPRFLGAFRIHATQKTSAAISEIGYAEMERIREREIGRKVSHAEVRRAVSGYLFRHVLYDNARSVASFFKLLK